MACRSRTAETYARISSRLPQGLGLGKQPTNSRLLKSLESFALKPTPLCLFASFLFGDLCFPLDHPFTMVLSAGTAYSLAMNHDRNRDVGRAESPAVAPQRRSTIRSVDLRRTGPSVGNASDRSRPSVAGRCLHGDSVERESDAEVADVGHERPRLSAIDRYADVQPIKRAQEAVKDPKPTFLEASLEHWVVKSRIPRLGLPRSSMLVRIQQFLDARVRALKVARPTHGADLLA